MQTLFLFTIRLQVLRLLAFVNIILRNSIKTDDEDYCFGHYLEVQYGSKMGKKVGRNESMHRPRSPSSDRTYTVQKVYLNKFLTWRNKPSNSFRVITL